MRSFMLLLRRELLFQWRTQRLVIFAALAILLLQSSIVVELLLPWIGKSQLKSKSPAELGPAIALLDRDPSMIGAMQGYLKNFFFLSLGALLTSVGSIAADRRSGELVVLLVRPFSRLQVVCSRWFGATLSAWFGLLVSGVVFVVVAWPTLGAPQWGPLLLTFVLLAVFLAVYTAMGVMVSAWSESVALAAGLGLGLVLLSNVLGFVPGLQHWVPEGCYKMAMVVAFGMPRQVAPLWVLLCNVAWIGLCILLARQLLQRKEP